MQIAKLSGIQKPRPYRLLPGLQINREQPGDEDRRMCMLIMVQHLPTKDHVDQKINSSSSTIRRGGSRVVPRNHHIGHLQVKYIGHVGHIQVICQGAIL